MSKRKKWSMLFLAGICCLTVCNGCGSGADSPSTEPNAEQGAQISEESGTEAAQGDAAGEEEGSAAEAGDLGDFSIQDIHGETYTPDMFGDYDLTMINVFATWCSPCISEIPDLQKLSEEMEGQGVNVVGIVLDSVDASGNANEDAIEIAKALAEQTGASYPFLVPDSTLLNSRLAGIQAVPETFFVDKEGKIVGETYTGSRSLEEWKSIVETEQQGVSQ